MKLLRLMPALALLGAVGCGMERGGSAPSGPTRSPGDAALSLEDSDEETTATLNSGAVYTLSNSVAGNEVLAFARAADGTLSGPTRHPTGGAGTGGGLGNQGALILGHNGQLLFAVNAGSDEVSVLRVSGAGLNLLGKVHSGGVRPISLTRHGRLLYVLNAGGSGNIAGFRIGPGGLLTPIRNSSRPLSSAMAGAAQIGFSNDGDELIVTEKATNVISTYRVDDDGRAFGPRVNASNGQTPFGFAFNRRGTLIVSEAFGGAPGLSAVSSYRLGHGGSLRVVSGSAATTQSAACWIAVTGGGRYAYTTNTASNTITGYAVERDGSLNRLTPDGISATTEAGPIDAAFGSGSRYLYVLNSGGHSLGVYARGPGGSLTPLPGVAGLPAGANGLAAS